MDAYDRKARLYPAICALVPLTVVAATMFELGTWWTSLISLGALGGFHIFVIQVVRDMGVAAQKRLWSKWGGNPTSVQLRDRAILGSDALLKDAVIRATGVCLPSTKELTLDPHASALKLDEAVAVLRERTRDQGAFPIVRSELANYGFRRNLYALKPVALSIAGVALALSAALLLVGFQGHFIRWGATGLVALTALAIWIWIVRPKFVRTDAIRYATALLATAKELNRTSK